MHGRQIALALALLVASSEGVSAQGIECPEVDFTTEVGSRVITLRWQDPPLAARSRVSLSLRKVGNFLPGDDSLAWRGTALPSVSGLFAGRCDFLYRFAGTNRVQSFTTVDSAVTGAGWTSTSRPVSGGTYRDCDESPDFSFVITQGGSIDSTAGEEVRLAWSQGDLRSGTLVYPPSYAPRALVEVADGLSLGFTPGALAAGDSFTVATRVPTPVTVRWFRFRLPNLAIEDTVGTPANRRLEFCRPDTALVFDNGLSLSLSPGSVFNADFDGDSVAIFRVRGEAFDGYRIRRNDIANLVADSMVVLREYYFCRDDDAPFFEGTNRIYVDTQVHNGFPYRYAVTCFDTLSHAESAADRTDPLYPRTPPGGDPGDIRVVPNPYKRRVAWEEGGESKVQFINVPAGTRLRIYTASGSLVREIPSEEISLGCGADVLPGCINWNLRNGQGEEIVSGIYIFHAESPGGRTAVGKFMIAR